MTRAPEAPILLADYDPAWPAAFESERERLAELLGNWLRGSIEHIGSTAVPGLRAKPVLADPHWSVVAHRTGLTGR